MADTMQPATPSNPPLTVIVGPTASGKSALALRLAQQFPVELVNADARAFYRAMDIGTAKPSIDDRARVRHHLIDILDPAEPMSLATFQDLTFDAIADIHGRHRLPVLVGGTPQYVNAVVENWSIPRVPPDVRFRAALEDEVEQHGVAPLLERLSLIDPLAAGRIGPNARRVIRALEVFRATGSPISALQGKGPPRYDTLEIELVVDRARLYERIDRRVDSMIGDGLIDEVRGLIAAGVPPDATALSAIGYRQLLPYLRGEISREAAIERIKFDTHRLVRSQQTWFRRNPRMVRVDMDAADAGRRVVDLVEEHSGGWLRAAPSRG
ncbi:MAG TPA: tRNA (adenosine(37)-N6)-dimethylallyltransferase MiaA [Thermomicrobiales bacterium]|nr:tRNA (adenosine(37)-N6)-dimethylallyltransferase MiaA [Thermomicrobiales bacterium]